MRSHSSLSAWTARRITTGTEEWAPTPGMDLGPSIGIIASLRFPDARLGGPHHDGRADRQFRLQWFPGGEMTAKKLAATARRKVTDVDTYMRGLEHPCKKEMQALRRIILDVDSRITEEIKWNAPSFALGEHFVTFNAWAKDYVQLIFHHG